MLDLLLPPQCLTCDATVDQPGLFCAACFRRAHFVTEPCCARCGVPFDHAVPGVTDPLCPTCEATPPPWSQARAALNYDAQSRPVLLGLKYGDRTEHATALARMMARAGAKLLARADLLVPVPLHRRRLVARRYNQSALLAHALARLSGVKAQPDLLLRTRATPSLGQFSAKVRAAAVQDAFAVRPTLAAYLAGKRVLLVDDVLTSGATCGACARVLLDGGAAGVDVLVAARVPDPRVKDDQRRLHAAVPLRQQPGTPLRARAAHPIVGDG